jgi:hypothetical protein
LKRLVREEARMVLAPLQPRQRAGGCRFISIERGRYDPSLELAWKLSSMLCVTTEELFCFTEGD